MAQKTLAVHAYKLESNPYPTKRQINAAFARFRSLTQDIKSTECSRNHIRAAIPSMQCNKQSESTPHGLVLSRPSNKRANEYGTRAGPETK
mmetsp:Transcript_22382/g.66355  ORF Transcript_22382/g.66355 Transcript_22382/m.66355 type:complete len:91 (-) Transcript_22382:883-1155(-)